MFVLSIVILLLRDNLLSLFLGWDILGVSSYFLIVYYRNWKSQVRGMLTIIINRLGDCVFIRLIGITIFYYNSWWYTSSLMIGMVLFIGLTKRAQFPFSSWLPAAIAAPTPISALVHSRTLVTAGYLLLFKFVQTVEGRLLMEILFWVSLVTLLYRGGSNLVEVDFKKIVALSTLSQVSFILLRLRLGQFFLSYFHLITHALFKRLLFIRVGGIIHYYFNSQDSRKYRRTSLTMGRVSLLISLINLIGLLWVSGLYSKDLILEIIFRLNSSIVTLRLTYTSILLTFIYSFRILFTNWMEQRRPIIYNLSRAPNVAILGRISLIRVFLGALVNWITNPLVVLIINTRGKLIILFYVFIRVILTKMIALSLRIKRLYSIVFLHLLNSVYSLLLNITTTYKTIEKHILEVVEYHIWYFTWQRLLKFNTKVVKYTLLVVILIYGLLFMVILCLYSEVHIGFSPRK